MKIRSLLFYP